MNDRLITAAGLIAALYVAWALIVPSPQEAPPSIPTSEDRGPDGYAALHRWLTASGIQTQSWRTTWSDLVVAPDNQGSGHILFTTLTHQRNPTDADIDALHAWLDAGNTLVMAATLNDTPPWSLQRGGDLTTDIRRIVDVDVEAVLDTEGETVIVEGAAGKGRIIDVAPVPAHPLMDGIDSLAHVTDHETQIWRPATTYPSQPLLKAAVDKATGAPMIWERSLGNGSIIVISSGTLITNRMLGEKDNRLLITNLLKHRLGTGGRWLFDDHHQGLSNTWDPGAFFSDPRFGYSMLFLLAGWFIYMLGSTNRLSPVHEHPQPPRQIDYIRAVGGLMARKLSPADTVDQLLRRFARELGVNEASSDHHALWTRLAALPTLRRDQLVALQDATRAAQSGKASSLVAFFNTLQKTRKSTG